MTTRPAEPPQKRVELTAIVGYQLNTDVGTSAGQIRVDDTPLYGAQISFLMLPGSRVRLLWLYSDPGAKYFFGGTSSSSFKVASHYFQIGSEHSIRRDRIEPFLGGTIGAALYLPPDQVTIGGTTLNWSDTVRFAFTVDLGLKVHLSESLLLRFAAGVAAPIYFSGGGLFFGSGGSGVAVSGGIPLWQWNFSGGLGFSL